MQKEVSAKLHSGSMLRSRSNSPIPASIERQEEAMPMKEAVLTVVPNSGALQSNSKEPDSVNVDKEMSTPRRSERTIPRLLLKSVLQDEAEPSENIEDDNRSPSPNVYYEDNGQQTEGGRAKNSAQMSPTEYPPKKMRRVRWPTPQRSPSRSPYYRRERGDFNDNAEKEWRTTIHRRPEELIDEYRYNVRVNLEEGQGLRPRDVDGFEWPYRNSRSMSPMRVPRQRRPSPVVENRRTPSVSLVRATTTGIVNNARGEQIGRTSELALSSTSKERKRRRFKFAVGEAQRFERKKEGKKPFYLTLNADGVPYGPGRLAWVAEVNRLATNLDPSCTHIKKQTHEDMCILKERLDDHFEYSGNLNRDCLRTLLGKAVTRRTELISYIRNGGKQPLNFDPDIWDRLEKLAGSTQRLNKTEHARYANACRRTMGRTGSLGMEGVRRKLSAQYGRSPDPDEIAEEMERDKGYGKKDLGSARLRRAQANDYEEDMNENLEHTQPQKSVVDNNSHAEGVKQMSRAWSPSNDNGKGKNIEGRGLATDRRQGAILQLERTSKDEYIAHLEAELRKFTRNSGNASSSRSLQFANFDHRVDDNSERAMMEYKTMVDQNRRGRRAKVNMEEAEDHSDDE